MATLRVTESGEVRFEKDVLEHLGIRPGEKVELALLPGGRAELEADTPSASWDDLRGFFVGRTNGRKLTIDEIGDAIAEAGAEAGIAGLTKP